MWNWTKGPRLSLIWNLNAEGGGLENGSQKSERFMARSGSHSTPKKPWPYLLHIEKGKRKVPKSQDTVRWISYPKH